MSVRRIAGISVPTAGWLSRRKMFPILWVGLAIGGCSDGAGQTHIVTTHFGGTAVVLDLPAELEATPLESGGLQLFRADAKQRRTRDEMILTRAVGISPIPLRQTFGKGMDAVRYGVALTDGGSGGAEGTLVAERACGDIALRLRLETQSEDLQPRAFTRALPMLAAGRCSKVR